MNDDQEVWAPIPGFPGYEASTLGRILSHRHNSRKPRLMRGGMTLNGYRQVTLATGPNEYICKTIHGLIARTFHGPRPEGLVVRHLDGDKLNNAASNLTYGTPSENALDSVRHGSNHNASKHRCYLGHPLHGHNLYVARSGKRVCRTCKNRVWREMYNRRLLAAANVKEIAA